MDKTGKKLTVCLLQKAHLSDVASLEQICFSDPWSEKSLTLLTEDGGLGVVILLEEQVVAYGGMTMVLDEGSVTNIAVHPDFRRKGLGRRIVRALLREAEKRSVTSVFLEVRESNFVARELYRTEGFEECGVRKNFYRHPTESAIQMFFRQT